MNSSALIISGVIGLSVAVGVGFFLKKTASVESPAESKTHWITHSDKRPSAVAMIPTRPVQAHKRNYGAAISRLGLVVGIVVILTAVGAFAGAWAARS